MGQSGRDKFYGKTSESERHDFPMTEEHFGCMLYAAISSMNKTRMVLSLPTHEHPTEKEPSNFFVTQRGPFFLSVIEAPLIIQRHRRPIE
jgi:hypothetical protein